MWSKGVLNPQSSLKHWDTGTLLNVLSVLSLYHTFPLSFVSKVWHVPNLLRSNDWMGAHEGDVSFLICGWEVTRTLSWRTCSQLCSPGAALSQPRLAPLSWHIVAGLQLLIDIAQTVSVAVCGVWVFSFLKRVVYICQVNDSCCGRVQSQTHWKEHLRDDLCENKSNQRSMEPCTKEVTAFVLSVVFHRQLVVLYFFLVCG